VKKIGSTLGPDPEKIARTIGPAHRKKSRAPFLEHGKKYCAVSGSATERWPNRGQDGPPPSLPASGATLVWAGADPSRSSASELRTAGWSGGGYCGTKRSATALFLRDVVKRARHCPLPRRRRPRRRHVESVGRDSSSRPRAAPTRWRCVALRTHHHTQPYLWFGEGPSIHSTSPLPLPPMNLRVSPRGTDPTSPPPRIPPQPTKGGL
jgi:hypothetical protein